MRKSNVLRASLVVAALGATFTANAFYFTISGTVDSNGLITGTTNEFSSLAEFGNNYVYDLALNPNTGDIGFEVTNGSSTVDFTGTGPVVISGSNYAFSGSAVASGAAGTSIMNGATGTYSSQFDLSDGYFNFTLGGANPVPEPASMTALGLGVAALIRRRKKA